MNKSFSLLIGFLLVAGLIPQIKAQTLTTLTFDKLNPGREKAVIFTECIAQDKDGFIWFGTRFGLYRFDGKNYLEYKNIPGDSTSLSYDSIFRIFVDSHNNLWVSTSGSGLNFLDRDRKTFKRFLPDPKKPYSISDKTIWAISEDTSGNLWMVTSTGGLSKYEMSTGRFIQYNKETTDSKELKTNYMQAVCCDTFGNVWVGTYEGVYRFDKQNKTFTRLALRDEKKGEDIYTPIRSINIDRTNSKKIWIGTNDGLFLYDRDNNNIKHFYHDPSKNSISSNSVTGFYQQPDGTAWIATHDGLNCYDENSKKFMVFKKDDTVPNSLNSGDIGYVTVDASGSVWVSCMGSGVYKSIKSNFENINLTNGKNYTSDFITAVAESQNGDIWISKYYDEVYCFDPEKKTFARYKIKNQKADGITYFFNTMTIDKQDNIWLGTRVGLFKFNRQMKRFERFDAFNKHFRGGMNISAITAEEDTLWLGTFSNGIICLDRNDHSFSHINLIEKFPENPAVNSVDLISRISTGELLISTVAGLVVYDPEKDSFEMYRKVPGDSSTISDNEAICILEDSKNNIWIGTMDGLNRFDIKTKKFERYNKMDNLTDNNICGILEDDKGDLWISTLGSIAKFVPQKKQFINYSLQSAFLYNVFSYGIALKSREGYYYFGSNTGATFFKPQDLIEPEFNPPLKLTRLEISGTDGEKSIFAGILDALKLNYRQNDVTFRFAALDYNMPYEIEYEYKLENLDKHWNKNGNMNIVNYKNLTPGKYDFMVRVKNKAGIIGQNMIDLPVLITPPFWSTSWFRLIILLLALVLLFMLHNIRSNIKTRQVLRMEQIKKLERDEVRKKTAIDFHDELGHKLTRISLLTEVVKKNHLQENQAALPLLDKILENTKSLYDGTKDFVWSIDPKNDTLPALLSRLEDFGQELFSLSTIEFESDFSKCDSGEINIGMDWQRQLVFIFKEAMNNALKYSAATQVILKTIIENDELTILLTDNGKGFDFDKAIHTGYGLANMIKRAGKIGCSVKIVSALDKGTQIIFKGQLNNRERQL